LIKVNHSGCLYYSRLAVCGDTFDDQDVMQPASPQPNPGAGKPLEAFGARYAERSLLDVHRNWNVVNQHVGGG
jgi:hypothetical protein